MPEINFKQGLISYDVVGPTTAWAEPAPSILFIHGVGADREIWSEWRHVLAARFMTIALDMPGHGQSFRPGSDLDWTIDDLAAMAHEVAADAGAGKAEGGKAGAGKLVLIGESVGGTVCLAAAAGRSEVAAVVTCSTAHIGGTLEHVRGWRELFAEHGMAGWSADMLEKRFAEGQTNAARRDWFDRTQQASDAETILKLADILVGLDYSDRLAEITCPVLLIQPDSSPFIPLEIPVALKAGLPEGELMVIPGARHGIACSHALLCAGAAANFLGRRGVVETVN